MVLDRLQATLAAASAVSILGFVIAATREKLFFDAWNSKGFMLLTPGDVTTQALALAPVAGLLVLVVFAALTASGLFPSLKGETEITSARSADSAVLVTTAKGGLFTNLLEVVASRVQIYLVGLAKRSFRAGYQIVVVSFLLFLCQGIALGLLGQLVDSQVTIGNNISFVMNVFFIGLFEMIIVLCLFLIVDGVLFLFSAQIISRRQRIRVAQIIVFSGVFSAVYFSMIADQRINFRRTFAEAFSAQTNACYMPDHRSTYLTSDCTIRMLERGVIFFDTHMRKVRAFGEDAGINIAFETPDLVDSCWFDGELNTLKDFVLYGVQLISYTQNDPNRLIRLADDIQAQQRDRTCKTWRREQGTNEGHVSSLSES